MTKDIANSRTMLRALRLRFCAIFLTVLIADQVTKQIMLALIFNPPRWIEIAAILNFVPVWNRGMSFGMLADGGILVPIGLTSLAIAVSASLPKSVLIGIFCKLGFVLLNRPVAATA